MIVAVLFVKESLYKADEESRDEDTLHAVRCSVTESKEDGELQTRLDKGYMGDETQSHMAGNLATCAHSRGQRGESSACGGPRQA